MISKTIFLLLIPGTIYSVALIDLLKLFRHKDKYWESIVWGLLLYGSIIVGWINMYDDLPKMVDSIFIYFIYMFSPLVFAQAVFVLVPNDDSLEMKTHFLKIRRLFYSLITFVIAFNFIFQFIIEDSERSFLRSAGIIAYGLNIFFDKLYLRVIAMLVTLAGLAGIFYYELY